MPGRSGADIGDRVWVPHDEHAWLCGQIARVTATDAEISTEVGRIKMPPSQVQLLDHCGSHVDDDVENLVDLDELSEGAILHHVRKRFNNRMIYTHVGAILVAVNPFERLDIYGEADIRRASNVVNTYPHVFITASVAYQQLRMNMKNQSVLISGESGAGKTETTKKVLNYLANVAPALKGKSSAEEPGMEDKILQSNPLLEALGNAKTLRNNNSSRFGKWMKVDFDHNFRIQGCEIVNYLLEKSRVVTQSTGERNYHIFYQLAAGADDEFRRRCALLPVDKCAYLNTSGCLTIEGVDDAADFREVQEAMNTLQFSADIQNQMMQIIAAIMHMGNIEFSSGKSEGSSQVNAAADAAISKTCELLGLQVDSFKYALTEKRVQMGRGSVVSIKLNPVQAMDSKDTLCKALYSNMFDWVIRKVNETLKTNEAPFSIGILDIFGFEVFDVNSFEQLCINYANEKLQFHFNEVIFNEEMKMYTDEGVPSEAITFVDNGQCVELIESKPMGLLSLLDEECSLGKATDLTYANKIEQAFGKNRSNENPFFSKHKTRPEAFTVHHFAGPVEYLVTNFLDKNKDTLSATLHEVAALSELSLVADLFATEPDDSLRRASMNKRQSKAQIKSTLGGQFRNQLIGLITNLRLTEPHFIRCVKPNHLKKPSIFDGQLALRQLRYAGLFEAIRIRQSGFAYRVAHSVFTRQFVTLVDGLSAKVQAKSISEADACQAILEAVTAEGILHRNMWCVGTTKVFIKTNQDRIQLEKQRVKRVEVFAVRLQAFARSVLARLKLNEKKYERIREEKKKAEEIKKMTAAALVVQRVGRGFVVRKAMKFMAELVSLRRELSRRNVENVEALLKNIKELGNTEPLAPIFQREVDVAKTMVKLIKIQDKYVKDIDKAIRNESVADLNRLLVRAERLDLSTHPSVTRGKEKLSMLHRKRTVMKTMVDFLRSENDICEVIPETLEQAEMLGVDPDFIAKVQRIYESASPRLRARNKLRRAIETIDKSGVVEAIAEVSELQDHYPKFAEMELRAAKSLLRMLEFEDQLCGSAIALGVQNVMGGDVRLSDEILGLCHEICASADNRPLCKSLRSKLLRLAGSSDVLENWVRWYKWSKVYCTWKYPEVIDKEHRRSEDSVAAEEEGEFFGLRPADARSSVYVIRTLHQDVNVVLGDAPASIQAALGSLNMGTSSEEDNQPKFNKHLRRRMEMEKTASKRAHETTGKITMKGATPKLEAKEKLRSCAGRKTSYFMLAPSAEKQLLESRKALTTQKKVVKATRARVNRDRKNVWH